MSQVTFARIIFSGSGRCFFWNCQLKKNTSSSRCLRLPGVPCEQSQNKGSIVPNTEQYYTSCFATVFVSEELGLKWYHGIALYKQSKIIVLVSPVILPRL